MTAIIAKIFALGIIGTLGTIILTKAGKQDLAILLDLALIIIALGLVFDSVFSLFDKILNIFTF